MPRDIKTIAAEIFHVDHETLDRASTPDDIEKWDSLAHLRLITAVEAEYGVRLSMQQIQGIRSLGDVEDVVTPGARAS